MEIWLYGLFSIISSQPAAGQIEVNYGQCFLWNVLLSCCFPESYDLPSFTPKINRIDLISLLSAFCFFFVPLLELIKNMIGLHPESTEPDWRKCKLLGSMLDAQVDINRRKLLTIDSVKSFQDILKSRE